MLSKYDTWSIKLLEYAIVSHLLKVGVLSFDTVINVVSIIGQD